MPTEDNGLYSTTEDFAMRQSLWCAPGECYSYATSSSHVPAMIVRHMSGNLVSRFTDFLISDGEKPWRNRDAEFEERAYARGEVERLWDEGWRALEEQLAALDDSKLADTVAIRGAKLTVHEALSRALAHAAYHVGQIVLLARIGSGGNWDWISIPKGQSGAYNANPTMEKQPR